MPSHSPLPLALDRTHRAFIVGTRSHHDDTVVLYLSRRFISPTTGVGYRTARISSAMYSDYLAVRPDGGSGDEAVEIVFGGTNHVRTITATPADSVPTDEYLTRDGGYDWSRCRGRPRWRIQLS